MKIAIEIVDLPIKNRDFPIDIVTVFPLKRHLRPLSFPARLDKDQVHLHLTQRWHWKHLDSAGFPLEDAQSLFMTYNRYCTFVMTKD